MSEKDFMSQIDDSKEVQVTYRTAKSVHLALKQAALDEQSSVKQILDRLVKQYLRTKQFKDIE
jgi:hypothetical protein